MSRAAANRLEMVQDPARLHWNIYVSCESSHKRPASVFLPRPWGTQAHDTGNTAADVHLRSTPIRCMPRARWLRMPLCDAPLLVSAALSSSIP
jgi:hypothetical protein